MADGCVFCGIVSGDLPSRTVMESDRAVAFLDINPATEGHTLVVPRAHAEDIWDLRDEDGDAVWALARSVARRLRDALEPEGMTLFQANRAAGWQDVFHFHVHLVPRWEGDGLTKPWRVTPADEATLDAVLARLTSTR
jgi:histidine triad (HIT) family protein